MENPKLRNFLRMSAEDFELLLNWAKGKICKRDTKMRLAISPSFFSILYIALALKISELFRSPRAQIYLYKIHVYTTSSDKLQTLAARNIFAAISTFASVYTVRKYSQRATLAILLACGHEP